METRYLATEEVQALLLRLLVEFDEACREHGLRYSVISGTLLGAVRHGGFIPWDDDADVAMPRPDYDRMLAHPEWFGRLAVCSMGDGSGHFFPFAKVCDPAWRMQETWFVREYEEYLWLDVFPFDAIPDDDRGVEKLFRRQERLMRRGIRSVRHYEQVTKRSAKLLVKRAVQTVRRLAFPYREQFMRMDENARRLEWGSTERVGNVVWKASKRFRPAFVSPSDFDSLVELDFEGSSLLAIPSWDAFLAARYGDYMQLPPEDERRTHNAKVWRSLV